jgi:hypothetical protein
VGCSKAAARFFECQSWWAITICDLTDALVAVVSIWQHKVAFLLANFKVVNRAACALMLIEHIWFFTSFRNQAALLAAAGKWIKP